MTVPCDKQPMFDILIASDKKAHEKLDRISTTLQILAVQGEKVSTLEKKSLDIEGRVRKIEDQPRKFLVWCGGVISVVVAAWMIYRLNF